MEQIQWKIGWLESDSSSCLETYVEQQDEVYDFFCHGVDSTENASIIRQVKLKDTQIYGSYLKKDKIDKIEPKPINNIESSWTFWVLIITIALFILNLTTSFSRFKSSLKASISLREATIFARTFVFHSIQTIITYVTASILLSLLIVLSCNHYLKYEFGLNEFAIINAGILIYFLIKQILISASSIIFRTIEESKQYMYHDYFSKTLAITLLLPLIFASEYGLFTDIFLNISIAITFIIIIYKTIISFFSEYSNSKFNLIYFILYLCTVEIIPLLVIVKAISISGLTT